MASQWALQTSPTAANAAPAVAGPNAAPLAAAASIPAQLPPASPASGGDSAALGASATGADNNDKPWLDFQVAKPAASAPLADKGPWTRYQTAQPSQPAPAAPTADLNPWDHGYVIPTPETSASAAPKSVLDPWEPGYVVPKSAAPQAAATPVAEGPWTKYQDAPWLDFQAKPAPETTIGAFIDPYANNSVADDARLVGGLADKAVRNVVDGATLGYADKLAGGLDALTGRAPDSASALAAERAQTAQAMAQPGGLGTAEQIAGLALPAGAIGRGAALIGDAAGALPFGLGRLAASPLAQASATGATVGGLNAGGNDQDVIGGAIGGGLAGAGGGILGAGAGAVANGLARRAAPAVAAPSTQALKAAAQNAYTAADSAGAVVKPAALDQLRPSAAKPGRRLRSRTES